MPKRKKKLKKPVVTRFKVGDKVRVKHGITDADYPDMPLGGWAGTISVVHSSGMYTVRWHPKMTATFGGGLLYREYWFLKRWMMKKIAKDGGKDTDTSKNHVYTDWDAVDRFVAEFLQRFAQSPQ